MQDPIEKVKAEKARLLKEIDDDFEREVAALQQERNDEILGRLREMEARFGINLTKAKEAVM